MVDDILSVIEIAAPRERVWEAVTQPAQVELWMGCLGFRPIPGHIFYLQPHRDRRARSDLTGAIACRLEILDAPRRIAFSWGFPETPDTYVDIRLRNIPGGTHVKLTHTGWDVFDAVETEAMRGGLGHAWHTVALPALKLVAEA